MKYSYAFFVFPVDFYHTLKDKQNGFEILPGFHNLFPDAKILSSASFSRLSNRAFSNEGKAV
jgi:hypothetical protein